MDECLGRALVQCSVVEQRLLDEPDELALCDLCVDLGLGQLEEELEAGHLVILLKLKQDEERLILHIAVRCRDELVLQLIDA